MKANGWRIAGRVLGVVAFVLTLGISENLLSAAINAGFWWGILEFIGWLVDRNRQQSASPPIAFSRAEDAILYQEYEHAKRAQVDADNEERRVRESEHEAQLHRDSVAALRSLEQQRHEQFVESIRLSKERALAWAAAVKKATPAVAICSIVIAIASFGSVQFWYAVLRFDEQQLLRSEAKLAIAKNALSMKLAETQAATAERDKAQAALDQERLAAEAERAKAQAALDQKRLAAETALQEAIENRAVAERTRAVADRERARLEYAETERERVDTEADLVARLKGSQLITFKSLSTNQYAIERQNSSPELLAELAKLRAKAMEQLRKEYVQQAAALGLGALHGKAVQLATLQSLYQDAYRHVQDASLESLKAISLD